MTEHVQANLASLQAALEQATRDAKELMQRLSADLEEQVRQRESHLLDPPQDAGYREPNPHR